MLPKWHPPPRPHGSNPFARRRRDRDVGSELPHDFQHGQRRHLRPRSRDRRHPRRQPEDDGDVRMVARRSLAADPRRPERRRGAAHAGTGPRIICTPPPTARLSSSTGSPEIAMAAFSGSKSTSSAPSSAAATACSPSSATSPGASAPSARSPTATRPRRPSTRCSTWHSRTCRRGTAQPRPRARAPRFLAVDQGRGRRVPAGRGLRRARR